MKVFILFYFLTVLISCNQKNNADTGRTKNDTTSKGIDKPKDKIVYKNPGDTTQDFYVITLPKDQIKGILVLNARYLADTSKIKAYQSGIMICSIVPGSNYLNNLTSEDFLDSMDSSITEIVTQYKIPKNKVIIGGMSAAGTGAVRYAEYCSSNKSKGEIRPVGVFAVDPPLDYERLWHESKNSIERNFNTDAVNEAKMLLEFLEKNLNGSPHTNIKSYQAISPFCYSADHGGNAHLLNSLAIRLYTEPDVNWWIDNRRKDYYDLNAIDNAALINQLKLNGNSEAELIVTSNKGYGESGRHPHSWSIVDETALLDWCNKLFSRN